MDRSRFYAALRTRTSGVFGTSLSQSQVNGIEALLDEGQSIGLPLRQLSYVLATAYHETARTMQPIEEYGKGKGRPYGKPAGPYGKIYFGRGFVQLTWLANYQRAGEELGINLVKFPEKALDLDIAAEVIFRGMIDGWFTGKHLSDYIINDHTDYMNARRIVNGTDRARDIAGYATAFENALRASGYIGQAPKTLTLRGDQFGSGGGGDSIPANQPEPGQTITIPAGSGGTSDPVITPPTNRGLLSIISGILFNRKGA